MHDQPTSSVRQDRSATVLAGGTLVPFALLLTVQSLSFATVLDFETLPDGSPTTDNQQILDEYENAFGVTFELLGVDPSLGPRIAKVGDPQTAFQGVSRSNEECGVSGATRSDMPAEGQNVGCSFLTDDGVLNNNSYTLRVRYQTPVQSASGVLLDVDGPEEWSITARAQDESVISEIIVFPPGPDGVATTWSFNLAEDIWMIDFEQTGSSTGVGLAFDNFSPSEDLSSVVESVVPVTKLQVWPNPVRDTAVFQVPGDAFGVSTTLTVWDALGRFVSEDRLDESGRMSWAVSDAGGGSLPNGFYVARVDGARECRFLILR